MTKRITIDHQRKPIIKNASEFISCMLGQDPDLAAKRKDYVDYLAYLPCVEKIREHDLFTDKEEPMALGQVRKQMAEYEGIVRTHAISLRREDADRLGYNSAVQRTALLHSKRVMLYEHMKIDSVNLEWYVVLHNGGHHPYIHLPVHSAKDREGYLTKQSIKTMRSGLVHDIFRQDFTNIREKQTQSHTNLKEWSKAVIKIWIDEIQAGTFQSS